MPKRDGDNLVASTMLVIGNEALHAVEYDGVSELSPVIQLTLMKRRANGKARRRPSPAQPTLQPSGHRGCRTRWLSLFTAF